MTKKTTTPLGPSRARLRLQTSAISPESKREMQSPVPLKESQGEIYHAEILLILLFVDLGQEGRIIF
jgi:hypothetical protein